MTDAKRRPAYVSRTGPKVTGKLHLCDTPQLRPQLWINQARSSTQAVPIPPSAATQTRARRKPASTSPETADDEQAGAHCTKWSRGRQGAASGVDLVSADLHLSQPHVHGRGAALVHLPPVDVVGGETGTVQGCLGRRDSRRRPDERDPCQLLRRTPDGLSASKPVHLHGPASYQQRRSPVTLSGHVRRRTTPPSRYTGDRAATSARDSRRPRASSIAKAVFAGPGSASM